MRFFRYIVAIGLAVMALWPASVLAEPLFLEQTVSRDREELDRAAQEYKQSDTALGARIGSMLEIRDDPFALMPYEQNYLLWSYTNDINREPYRQAGRSSADQLDQTEAKYQFSLMFPIWRGIFGSRTALSASYTQLALWQAANSDISAPFRETNYEPQLFLVLLPQMEWDGWNFDWFEVGINHQSNGQSEPLSRSWNRLYANFAVERNRWVVSFKPWYRIPESSDDDDNPDITDYLGHYRLSLAYKARNQVFTALSRYNWSTGKGSLELGWSYPLTSHVRFYTQFFSGYGDTLIDYNHSQNRIGIGLMLNDLL
ncbi:MAG: phospholipase A [Halopseudomonas sp.]